MSVSAEEGQDPEPSRGRGLARLLPIALTIVIFGVLFFRIPFDRFQDAIAGARLLPFAALMASFSLCFFAMDTFVLSKLVAWFHGPLRYRDLLPVRASTYVVALVNTQLAQGALALYIHRRFGTPIGAIAGTIGVLILLEVTQLFLFATAGMIVSPSSVPPGLLLAPIGLLGIWGLLALVAKVRLGSVGERIRDSSLFQSFRRSGPRHWATILALKAPVFVLSLFIHWYALGLFGIHIPLTRLLAFLPIVYLVGALPVTVAHLGTSQAAWVFFFNDHAAEADLLAYSLASHLTFMLANGTLGLVFLPRVYSDLFGDPPAGTEDR